MASLELEMEVGVSPPVVVSMSYSDDGGRNWSTPRLATSGAVDAYRTRLHWHRLGSFRQRTIRFIIQGSSQVSLLGAAADIVAGEH
jgi:Neuraminidase (sialidase)